MEWKNWEYHSGLFEINELLAHATLAKVCIIYLMKSVTVDEVMYTWSKTTYGYASTYWKAHTKIVQKAGPEINLDNLCRSFLDESSKAFQNWAKWKGTNPLYHAAEGGLIRSVRDLLVRGKYGNALQAAAWGGHEAIVWLLLTNAADVNAHGGRYASANHVW